MRPDGRLYDQLRPLTVHYDSYGYADASVLLELGGTKVLCAVSLQQGVPPFLKGTRTGWLKAEYAMLPIATQSRTQREASAATRSGRSVEISRLIGRSLRSMLDLNVLGERTVMVDCDVLQADGGTRTACITAASLALCKANERWIEQRLINKSMIVERLVGISVGVVNNQPLLDLSFQEDSSVDADFNLVLTESGSIVELQGTGERKAVAWTTFEQVWKVALQGAAALFTLFEKTEVDVQLTPAQQDKKATRLVTEEKKSQERAPLFSLRNRISA